VIAKGSDGRSHIPAYIAGQIYKSLRHRFGPGKDATPYASAPLTPRPKINPNAAAELSDEEKEEEAAGIGDDGLVDDAAVAPANNGVKSVIMTVPQTTQPGGSQSPGAQESQRPRRVHTTKP
jgi:hypothetical protein